MPTIKSTINVNNNNTHKHKLTQISNTTEAALTLTQLQKTN